jgi:hypothetical protein
LHRPLALMCPRCRCHLNPPHVCSNACVQVRRIAARRRDTVCISGLTGEGINELLDLIGHKLAESMTEVGQGVCGGGGWGWGDPLGSTARCEGPLLVG